MQSPPSQDVLDAFGVGTAPVRAQRGQGRAFFAGNIIVKRVDDPVEAIWVAGVLDSLPEDGFRVERPVRANDGEWLVDRWSAWRVLEGEHDLHTRWPEVIDVCAAFHRAIAELPRPAVVDRRASPWETGDRVAWDGPTIELPPPIGPLVDEVLARLRPIDLAEQVIHGDFGGNVLFAPGLPPAVIDFSPYYRPAGFASAVVIVDAMLWYSADPAILALVERLPSIEQLLLRAVVYRAVTSGVLRSDHEAYLVRETEAARAVVAAIDSRFFG